MAEPIEVELVALTSIFESGKIISGTEIVVKVAGMEDMELKVYYADGWHLWTNQRFGDVHKISDNSIVLKWHRFGDGA